MLVEAVYRQNSVHCVIKGLVFAYLFLNMAIMRQSGTDKKDNGWMTCDLTSFATVFQSYQDDKRTIMKGCVHWNSVYD